jgi:hypothetical protein
MYLYKEDEIERKKNATYGMSEKKRKKKESILFKSMFIDLE